jgi:hypothetical protein
VKFLGERIINKIQVPIVRVCNRQCPNCCAREQLTWYNKSITEKEISLDELIWAGKLIGKIEYLEITGGEPTLHSQFEELTNNLPKIFQCDDVMLVTNGWLFGKDPSKLPLLLKYKRFYLSHYTEQFVEKYGGVTNTNEINLVLKFLKEHDISLINYFDISEHFVYNLPYSGIPCGHYKSNMISYYEKYLYGCCVAWSIPFRGRGIPLTENWRMYLEKIETPCDQCFLSNL